MEYKAIVTPVGSKFQYVVTDEAGNVVSKRLSKRGDYIACTAFGDYYFGRRDLIGKGDHGRWLNSILAKKARLEGDPEAAYSKYLAYVKENGWQAEFTKEAFIESEKNYCANWLERLKVIFIEK